jgi:hypothetical protein
LKACHRVSVMFKHWWMICEHSQIEWQSHLQNIN